MSSSVLEAPSGGPEPCAPQHRNRANASQTPPPPGRTLRGSLRDLAWLPIPLLLAAIIILRLLNLPGSHESVSALLACNLLFSGFAGLLIVYLIARSFLVRSSPGLLLVGCGVLIYSAAGFVASAVSGRDANSTVTIHNICVLLSALCQVTGLILCVRGKMLLSAAGLWLPVAYGAAACAIALVAIAACAHWMPTFFVQGQGGTPLRESVLGLTIAMFALTAALLPATSRPLSSFEYWYSLALGLIATGLLGVAVQSSTGSPLNWTARGTQYLGGVYMLVAAIQSVREARVWGVPLESALRESEERFRLMQELSPDGFTILRPVLDSAGRVVDFTWVYENAAIARLNGTDSAAVVGQRLSELIPSHVESPFHKVYQRVAESGTPEVLEAPFHGETLADQKWLRVAVVPSGRDIAVLAQDITERKLAEEKIRQQAAALERHNIDLERRVAERSAEVLRERQQLKDVLNMLPAYVILLDPDYRVPLANRFFEERFGKSEGRRCYEYLFNQTEPCENCETYKVLKTGQPHRWEWTGPDGRNYDIHDFPFTDTDGTQKILEVGLDITERKRAQAALCSANAYNRSLIEASLDPLVTIGHDGQITDVNAATEQITGAVRAELIGSNFADYFTEPNKANAGYEEVLARGEVRDYPLTIRHRSGALTDVLYNAAVYRDQSGQAVGVFAAARDVTERKRAEAALKQLNATLEQRVGDRTAALRESEDRLRFALETSHIGAWDLDLIHHSSYRSPEHDRIFGYPELLPKWTYEMFLEHVLPEDRSAVDTKFRQAVETQSDWNFECRIRRSDDEVRWIWAAGRHRFDDSGARRMAGIVQDITERKKAEQRVAADLAALTRMHALSGNLLESQQFQPLLQEIMDAAVEIVGAERGTLQLLEDDSLHIVAHHGHEQPFLEFFASAETRASVCGEATRRGERVIVPDVEESPLFVGTPSQAVLREAGVRAVQSTPILSRTGKLLGILTTQWDVPHVPDPHDLWRIDLLVRQAADLIESAAAEELLRRGMQRFELLATTAGELLQSREPQRIVERLCHRVMEHLGCHAFFNFLVDHEAGRLHLNVCAGIPEEEARRIELLDYGAAVCGCAARDACRIVAERIPTTPDPRTELVKGYGIKAYACHPLFGQGGEVIGTLSFGTRSRETFSEYDLSLMKAVADQVAVAMSRMQGERALAEAKTVAEEANAAKDKFLAVLSHELRTPLSPVLMTASALEYDESLPESVREDMVLIRRSVELEVRLINDLLDFNRVKWGKLHLDMRPVEVCEKVKAAVDICRAEAEEKRIEIRCDLAGAACGVSADGARLQQVFWNLLKNAIKFTPEEGHIHVCCSNPDDRTVRVEITDSGIGIDTEALTHVFEPFVQASKHVTRQFGGLGLGLAISKSLVEMHGGVIRAESAGLGRGTTFIVDLPGVACGTGVSPVGAGVTPAPHRRGVRICLVEDNQPTADVLSKMLTRMGHQVLTAGTVREALAVLQSTDFDLLISDLGLPDGDGHDLMRQVRQLKPQLRAFAMSGYGQDGDLARSREVGFVEHLTKPVDLQTLQAAIARVAGKLQ